MNSKCDSIMFYDLGLSLDRNLDRYISSDNVESLGGYIDYCHIRRRVCGSITYIVYLRNDGATEPAYSLFSIHSLSY